MPERRFLVVRLSSLGDIVHAFPAVAALRDSFPSAEIVWLTQPRWKLLVASANLASRVWTTTTRELDAIKKSVAEIRFAKIETAIDYQGLWKSAGLPFLARVPRRIGFASTSVREFGVPLLYTDQVITLSNHVVDQNGELSKRAGAQTTVAHFTLAAPPQDEEAMQKFLRARGVERYVVLSPGGGWRSKCWPPERFGALCRTITEKFRFRCVVNYGPGEDDLAAQLRAAAGSADPLFFNGELGRLMALLRHALCLVGGDTGPLHLAVALGTPVVALFGPTDPARNGPYRPPQPTAWNPKSRPADSETPGDVVFRAKNVVTTHRRDDRIHPSMLEIQVDAVFDAVQRIVKARL